MTKMSVKQSFYTSIFLVLTGVCAALHIWKLPPALPSLQSELAIDLVESGFLLSTVQIGGMTLGLAVGLFAERIGLRRCILIGLSVLTLSSAGATLFDTKLIILLFRALEGCGFLMVILPVPALIKRIVPPEAVSSIMGFWGCYMGIGAVTILLVGSWLISFGSWRVLWGILAVITLLVLCIAFMVLPRERYLASNMSSSSNQLTPTVSAMIRATLSSKRVWMMALVFGTYAAQWSAIVGFLPTIYIVGDISGPMAGFLTALVAGSNIIGNLVAGRLLHKDLSPKTLLTTGFVAMIVCAIIAFGVAQNILLQFFAVLLFSAIGGLIPATLFFLAVTFSPGSQTIASTVGWIQQCSSLGQFLGPPAVAWVVNLLGGWQWSWVGTMAFALLGLVMVWQLKLSNEVSRAQ